MNFWYFELPPGNNDRKNLGKRRLNKDNKERRQDTHRGDLD